MLPLFDCSLFHDLIAALYNKHTGTLHCQLCVEDFSCHSKLQLSWYFLKSCDILLPVFIIPRGYFWHFGAKDPAEHSDKAILSAFAFLQGKSVKTTPWKIFTRAKHCPQICQIQAAFSSPKRPAKTHVPKVRFTQPNPPPPDTAPSWHLLLCLLHFQHSPSLSLPLSCFGTWSVFVDYPVCSTSTMRPQSLSVSAAGIYFFFPTQVSQSPFSESFPMI